jgi:hypothetical protein
MIKGLYNGQCGMQGRNQVLLEEIRFRWKESGFVGWNQVSLDGIRFRWKESGVVGWVVNMA